MKFHQKIKLYWIIWILLKRLHFTYGSALARLFLMIFTLGDSEKKAKGSFLLLDGVTFEPKELWNLGTNEVMGYDFWYQPRHNVMLSSEFGAPSSFMKGFDINDVKKGLYGTKLHFWNWKERTLINSVDLGEEGAIPLETRFLHNPDSALGYVGCALGSTVYLVHRDKNQVLYCRVMLSHFSPAPAKTDRAVRIQ